MVLPVRRLGIATSMNLRGAIQERWETSNCPRTMSFLRIYAPAKLVSSAINVNRSSLLANHRLASSKSLTDASSEQNQDSYLSNEEDPRQSGVDHQVDYDAHIDHGTSYVSNIAPTEAQVNVKRAFSPVPRRVMDGSEPGESVAAAVLSGAPIDLQARTVR